MVASEHWLALIDARDSGTPLADRFNASVHALARVHLEGLGYRRWHDTDPRLPNGPERYRTMIFEGSPWGVDTGLFRWSPRSRLIPLEKRLGVGLEFWLGVPDGPVLPWHAEGDGSSALADYLLRLATGAQGVWASLAGQDVTQQTVESLCFWHRRLAVPAYVRTMLYSDEYVIDHRAGGPFLTMPRAHPRTWYR